jgi:predicted DNA-binding protein
MISIRMPTEITAKADAWALANDTGRSEAIRCLVELGLTVKATKAKQTPEARADRAKELAGHAIEQMSDSSAHPEERANRGRRLMKGPEEFREVRVDRPKT